MIKKKRFVVSKNLAQGLSETISTAENHSGSIRFEVIALHRIEIDPENPRNLSVSPQDIVSRISFGDDKDSLKQQEVESLKGLAETIKEKGLINPVIVYKFGNNYRLLAGERRFLASLIAGMVSIYAKILDEKPSGVDLRHLQWIENTEREDLSLKDRIGNVEAIIHEYLKKNPNTPINATLLKNVISISKSQATAYIAILNAPDDVKQQISQGIINNLDKAAYLAKIESNVLRNKAIEIITEGNTLKRVKSFVENTIHIPKISISKKPGRLAKKVNLGSTTNPNVVKELVSLVTKHSEYSHLTPQFNNINWHDFGQSAKAFQMLISNIEKIHKN